MEEVSLTQRKKSVHNRRCSGQMRLGSGRSWLGSGLVVANVGLVVNVGLLQEVVVDDMVFPMVIQFFFWILLRRQPCAAG